ncbi:thiosulfate oxidation carrier protein SoxY [Methylophaga sp.]|uniref:thiosulfate oxidation carrier protein SoxY n=1 Tax=Methylophaga sp. TaxID=2024840 RepID=UPI003F69C305
MTHATNTMRRKLIKGAISASTLAMVAASGLILPRRVLAHWPSDAFTAGTVEDALLALLGEAEVATDKEVSFKIGAPPSYAVNGASVPVEVRSTLNNIERIAILVEKNPNPLAMSLDLTPDVSLPFKSMIKVAEDSRVIAVIRADGKLYRTSREIEVDIGGCA